MEKRTSGREPPRFSRRLYIGVPRSEIAYLKFVLEGYDNLAFMSVLDRFQALICLTFSPDQESEVRDLLGRLAREVDLREIPVPGAYPGAPVSR